MMPQFGGGRKPKLTDEQMIELKSLLKKKDFWTTREVLELIKEKYGVEYSLKRIGVILKNFGMHHSKPYILDYRRPKDAEEILKKLSETVPKYPLSH